MDTNKNQNQKWTTKRLNDLFLTVPINEDQYLSLEMSLFGIPWILPSVVNSAEWSDHSYQELLSGTIPKTTTALSLKQQGISHLDSDDFAGFHEVHSLKLTDNLLTVFPNLSSVARTLAELKIDVNRISVLPGEHLRVLMQLEILNLHDNALKDVTSDQFQGLSKLHTLNLAYNELMVLPDLSCIGGTLRVLTVTSNGKLRSVPPAHLNSLTKLETLNLNAIGLKSLPDPGGIWQPQATANLQTLDIPDNALPILYDYKDGLWVTAHGNPLVCNQRLAWLLRPSLNARGKCTSSQKFQSISYKDLMGSKGEFSMPSSLLN